MSYFDVIPDFGYFTIDDVDGFLVLAYRNNKGIVEKDKVLTKKEIELLEKKSESSISFYIKEG